MERHDARPKLLDLFSGAGGAARGYQNAGFHVTGVDIETQPRYAGDEFVLADALDYLAARGHEYDAIHASPPCQFYSVTRRVHPDRNYPDLIGPTRQLLAESGRPSVIENVEFAPLIDPVRLCGTMFGLKVFRHRLFETNFFMLAPPHASHVHYGKATKQGRPISDLRQYMVITGHFSDVENGRLAMGIDWMIGRELSQAIPPMYTEFVGWQLLSVLDGQKGHYAV